MSKISFLFSGQGSQYTGMCKELYAEFKEVQAVYKTAASVFGFDIADLSFNGEANALSQTSIAQPLIYTMSVAVFEAIKSRIGREYAVAGHSLGEYSALTCAGSVSLEQGMNMIKIRSEAMQKCATEKGGSMVAVIGTSVDEIEKICKNTDGYALPVNYNSPAQTVIAGEDKAVKSAADTLAAAGAKTIKLAVSSAFHSVFMEQASLSLYDYLKNQPFAQPNCPFYSNLTGNRADEIDDLAAYFKNHLVSPVMFTSELNAMQADGIDTFIEIGPGKILSGLVKKTLKDVSVYNIEDLKSLEKALPVLA